MPEDSAIESLLATVAAAAVETGVEVYLVGGFVRDRLLGHPSKDIDMVAVGSDGIPLIAAVARRRKWAPPQVFERFGTGQIRGDGFILEVVRARAESYAEDSRNPDVRPGTLEEDIMRRDFTVNALCQRIDGEVLDITGHGLDDLRNGVLRTPLDPITTFRDDPLRMFRGARFVAQLGFRLADAVIPAMRAEAHRVAILSVERIAEEVRRLLVCEHPREGLDVLRDGGLLDVALPELSAMVGVEQHGGYHIYDVFDHTTHAIETTPPDLLTRLGALFHDVGKPPTRERREDGRDTFYDHPQVGAAVTKTVLERLRFSTDEIDAVCRLVALHLRPIQYTADWKDGAVRRLIHDAGALRHELFAIAQADTLASAYPDTDNLDALRARMDALDDGGRITRLAPPLSGHEIMALEGGRRPGPWIGVVQRALAEAVLDGEIPPENGDAARNWLRSHRHAVPD